jgi:hypothetical protein
MILGAEVATLRFSFALLSLSKKIFGFLFTFFLNNYSNHPILDATQYTVEKLSLNM